MDLIDRINNVLDNKNFETQKYDWAARSEATDEEFQTLEIPIDFPYELDVFQKQAACHIAKHEDIIVTSHTGAGKSTVIELAVIDGIQTGKVFVTNPIKALSSQGYRKLKRIIDKNENIQNMIEHVDEEEDYYDYYEEEDMYYSHSSFVPPTSSSSLSSEKESMVGILTGDDQINETAPVVVMTTEILHSMLLRNVNLNELRWVVIDEAHTIDSERGHVIENVIAMLPEHVGIILLSATIPNAMDVAEWVGRNRRHPVFLTGTQVRPVPLSFYLHTGERTYDDKPMFLLKEGEGEFDKTLWFQCLKQFRENRKKGSGNVKHRWLNLIRELEEDERLPAIIFDFSKKRLEQYARTLQTLDYVPKRVKSRIVGFFAKMLRNVDEDDRSLPQIIMCKELALRGIGLHHGGMIPALKEITQVLFERGYLKVLFATETLAMGIDAPCKTTVFASLRKSDGKEYRVLNRSEFIQISGRAGRRGKDVRGNVVITMWPNQDPVNIPAIMEAKANKLVSKFVLKDQIILSLLRRGASDISIEDLMRSSFMENDTNSVRALLKEAKRVYDDLESKSNPALEELAKVKMGASRNASIVAKECFTQYRKQIKPGTKVMVFAEKGKFKPVEMTATSRPGDEGFFTVQEDAEPIRVDWVYSFGTWKPKRPSLEVHQAFEHLKESQSKLMEATDDYDPDLIDVVRKRSFYKEAIDDLRHKLSAEHLNCMPEYRERYQNLEKLQYISDGIITWKGRSACEINACDSIVLMEWLLGSNAPLGKPVELAALLVSLVYERSLDDDDENNLLVDLTSLKDVAKTVRGNHPDAETIPRPGLCNAIYKWASGSSFKEACSFTSEMPGTVVRVLSRLHEVLRELSDVGDQIGNSEIIETAKEADRLIVRGVPFLTSLKM